MNADRNRLGKAGTLALAAGAVLGAASQGCNLVVGADDYSVEGTHWGCVGSVTPPAATAGSVALTVEATQFTTGAPFEGLRVQACLPNDTTCATPIGPARTTDASGEATLTVPSGFEGYVDATATGMMESLVYLSSPVVSGATYRLNVGTYEAYTANVMAATGTVDPDAGALWVNMEDCLGQPAGGVVLSLDAPWKESADGFYFQSGAPVAAETQDETSINDSVGGLADVAIGGFADVTPTPGTPEITATLASNGEDVAQFTAIVRKQALTVISLGPTPLD